MNASAPDMSHLLSLPAMQRIQAYQGFYFEKARQLWEAFDQYAPEDLAASCQALATALPAHEGRETELLQVMERNGSAYKLLLLMLKLVSYLDQPLASRLPYNAYEDRRALATTHIRLYTWLKYLLRYKTGEQPLHELPSAGVRHALQYVQHPEREVPLLSTRKRKRIARELLGQAYDPHQWVGQVVAYLHGLPIRLANEANRTWLYAKLLEFRLNESTGTASTEALVNAPSPTSQAAPSSPPPPEPPYHPRELVEHIHAYVNGQGFYVSKQTIANLYLSLKAKPFVILAGISGSGKTQLARQFAAAIGAWDRSLLIPVQPDWTDNSYLLGYMDLNGTFREQPLLRFIRRAMAHPTQSFFVILDEMNLARVEHYFSDLLSLIELRERTPSGRIQSPPLFQPGQLRGDEAESTFLPENLYVIGTVNVDETTHPFSRKVLDRANTLEMSEVQLDWLAEAEAIPPLHDVDNAFLRSPYLYARDLGAAERQQLQPCLQLLSRINHLLQPVHLHMGYRVRDEIAFYLLNRYDIREAISAHEAMDLQLLQKVLPRIQGSSRLLGQVLRELIQLLRPELHLTPGMQATELAEALRVSSPGPYPKTVAKLQFMYHRLEEEGYASFWI